MSKSKLKLDDYSGENLTKDQILNRNVGSIIGYANGLSKVSLRNYIYLGLTEIAILPLCSYASYALYDSSENFNLPIMNSIDSLLSSNQSLTKNSLDILFQKVKTKEQETQSLFRMPSVYKRVDQITTSYSSKSEQNVRKELISIRKELDENRSELQVLSYVTPLVGVMGLVIGIWNIRRGIRLKKSMSAISQDWKKIAKKNNDLYGPLQ